MVQEALALHREVHGGVQRQVSEGLGLEFTNEKTVRKIRWLGQVQVQFLVHP